MSTIIHNQQEAINYLEDDPNLIFECVNCNNKSEDEELFNICVNCGNYICATKKCSKYKQYQGYEEIFCKKCRP